MTRLLTALVCAGILLTTTACGGDEPAAAGTSSSPAPAETPSEAAEPEQPAADPRTGADYCETLELLTDYVHADYGLDASAQTVDGALFAERLTTVAETYGRLSGFTTGEAAAAWSTLSDATTATGDVLRAAANDVQSETVIGQLAELAAVSQDQLPVATSNTERECGLDPAELTGVQTQSAPA